ncbi:TetR/AcrR family transcriptional regulator [Rhodococcus rhodochrous]|uniref:TetR/AcrR family transcriptional regulator n=1 Tax=Rhodococcus rhodochrous TaxID=1829 RepID=UPI001E64EBB8|nr:TetR/AcrR family transcriptional regulator [Rhodococcus rhodochrous]MCB8913092.1 TetR/AcrR family transcriptional regulator [Rhodococcus rhodochrous]
MAQTEMTFRFGSGGLGRRKTLGYYTLTERRAQLVRAAARVIAREGLSKATTRRIAEEASLNLAALHYSFRSKAELFAAVLENTEAFATGPWESSNPNSSPPLEDAVAAMLCGYQQLFDGSSDVAIAQYELLLWALRTQQSDNLAAQSFRKHVDAVADRLAISALAEGIDPVILADYLVGMLDGLVLQQMASHRQRIGGPETAALARYLVELARSVTHIRRLESEQYRAARA